MTEQPERGGLTLRRPRGFEDQLAPTGDSSFFGRGTHLLAQLPEIQLIGPKRHSGPVRGQQIKPLLVHIQRDNHRSQGCRNLDTEPSNPAGADEYRQVPRFQTAAQNRLIGRRDSIRDDGQRGQIQAQRVLGIIGQIRHRAQTPSRYSQMSGETAMHVTAREDLFRTNCAPARLARLASLTRNHGRNDHLAAYPRFGPLTRLHHTTADFVTEGQRERVTRRHAVVVEAQVRVTHATSGDLDEYFTCLRRLVPLFEDHGFAE